MDMLIIGFIVGGIVCGCLGYLLCAKSHTIAAAVTSAATRAVTPPAGVEASIAAVSPIAAKDLQAQTDALKQHITDTVAAATAALPKAGA